MYNRFRNSFEALPRSLQVMFIVSVICVAGLIGVLPIMFLSQPKSVVHTQQVIVEPTIQPTVVTMEDQTKIRDAIVRIWSTDEICYDEHKQFWFIHFPPNPEDENPTDQWYYIEHDDIQITPLGNNTSMIMNPYALLEHEVWPDVTGLSCTKHTITNE